MRKIVIAVILICISVVIVPALAQSAQPAPLDTLETGIWNVIKPGGETVCSDGSEYSFFVRPVEDSEKLMIYFQGGGACWNAFTCAGQFYDKTVGTPETELNSYNGIFNYAHPENPMTEYSTVFIPVCTGDVHVGDATVKYSDRLTVQHKGAVNAQAALDWTYANYDSPAEIAVIGTSAGAIGSIYFAPQVMAQYPDAQILQFADGEVGVAPEAWNVLDIWNVYAHMTLPAEPDTETFTINDIYLEAAQTYPQHQFAQYTTTNDEVQVRFYQFSDDNVTRPWLAVAYEFLDELEANLPNFRAFAAGGDTHTILARPGFYFYGADGTRFANWFTALLNRQPVENVRCAACDTVEIVEK